LVPLISKIVTAHNSGARGSVKSWVMIDLLVEGIFFP
jgi:hypothetical protein